MPNLETKAPYPDLAEARRIAQSLHAAPHERLRQTDTYFSTRQGRLKLREISALDDPAAPARAELIPYLRADTEGARVSDYLVQPVADPLGLKRLFTAMLGVEIVVEKVREVYLVDNVRIHLDAVEGLGGFLELEAVYDDADPQGADGQRGKVEALLAALHLGAGDLLAGSYRELCLAGLSDEA